MDFSSRPASMLPVSKGALSGYGRARRSAPPRRAIGAAVLAATLGGAATFCFKHSSLAFALPRFRSAHCGVVGPRFLSARPADERIGKSARRVEVTTKGGGSGAVKLAIGERVKARSEEDLRWYHGAIQSKNEDGTFTVRWDDPDGAPPTEDLPPEMIKPVVVFNDFKVGEEVEAVWEDGTMHPARIVGAEKSGTFEVEWLGFPKSSTSTMNPQEMRYPPILIPDLKVGQHFKGTVTAIVAYGAWVDIGAERDGLLHISGITNGKVEDLRDHISEEQEIDVWVSMVKRGRKPIFALSMIEGAEKRQIDHGNITAFREKALTLRKEWLTGVVLRTFPYGIFVNVTLPGGEAWGEGFVHVSEIRDHFVESVEDEFFPNDEVRVRVLTVDSYQPKMTLTMKESATVPDLSAFEPLANNSWVTGIVTNVEDYGVFVKISADNGQEATDLVHISSIKDGYREIKRMWPGQEVRVRIFDVDHTANKIKLSMREPLSEPVRIPKPLDKSAFDDVDPTLWHTATIIRLVPPGLIVTLKVNGVEAQGFVRRGQISESWVGSISEVADELGEDQEIQVRILSLKDSGNLDVTMKPVPMPEEPESYDEE